MMVVLAIAGAAASLLSSCSLPSQASPESSVPFPLKHGKLASKDAGPIDLGCQEIEFAMTHRRAGSEWNAQRHSTSRAYAESTVLSVGYGLGITGNRDFEVSFDYKWLLDREGYGFKDNDFSDTGISSRWRFLNKDGGAMQAAWVTGFTFSTGPSSTSQGFTSWDNNLVFSKDFGYLSLLTNLKGILALDRDDQDRYGEVKLNLALGYQVAKCVQPVVELNYLREFLPDSQYAEGIRLTAGIMITPSSSYRVDLGFQQSIYGKDIKKDSSIIVKLKYLF